LFRGLEKGQSQQSILTGLAGLSDRTRCHIEWLASGKKLPRSELTHYARSAAQQPDGVTSTCAAHSTLTRATLDKFQTFVLIAPVLLFSMVAHEYAHGYAALRNGDPTAYQLGRLTWNPARHIDPFLTIILPLLTFITAGIAFGGAKPVPVNPRNYRNFKKGDIIVSLAGVTTNVIIAFCCVPVILLAYFIGSNVPPLSTACSVLQLMLLYGILLNLVLAAFNLIPIPPLDGSHVMKYLLPPAWSLQYQRFGRQGMIVLFVLIAFAPGVLNLWLRPVYALNSMLTHVVTPYIIPSRWTS
jgi:Zn-dependent protease